MEAYTLVNDSVIDRIRNSTNPNPKVQEARTILERIENRQLYMFIGEFLVDKDSSEWDLVNLLSNSLLFNVLCYCY